MRRNKRVFTHVPNPVEDLSVPPSLPVNPTTIKHVVHRPEIGVPEVGVPYVEPVDVVPPPLFRLPLVTPVSAIPRNLRAEEPMLMTLPDESDKTNNGVFPCITYGGTDPIYASRGDIIGLSGDIANLSNEVTNLSGYVYNIQVDPSSWSLYPAVSFVDLSQNAISNCSRIEIDEQVLTADASDLLLNGIPIATITSISNVADWALFPAISNVNVSNFALQNVSGFQLDGNQVSTLGNTILVNGFNPVSNWAAYQANASLDMAGFPIFGADTITSTTMNAEGLNVSNNLAIFTATTSFAAVLTSTNSGATLLLNSVPVLTTASVDTSNWATYPAVTNVDMSGFAISNTPSVSISGNTQNVVLTASGTELLVDGQPVYTGSLPPSDVANWATYPAVANVNMSGFAIQSTTDLSLTSGGSIYLASTSNIKVQTKMETKGIEMTGLLSQTFAGSGCNFFGSAVQVGTNGVLPTDNFGSANIYGGNIPVGLSTLYVQGGTTLDGGGTVHGITIGTLPVAGINTQRIDVLPVGIEMTTPTFITMNGLGAANIAMGGAIAIAAGSYVTLEHGIGLGQNGIFLQNSGRGDGCRVIFTGGGTLYNATQVQASEIINPTGVQFYNGVFNPSGGSVPIVPPVYGRAVVDISSAGCYLANLTGGAVPAANKNSNAVFVGNFPNLTTSGATSTIAIGDNDGMTGQGANAIAIGTEAGSNAQGSGAVAIGFTAGSTSQQPNAVAIGYECAFAGQRQNAVAIGTFAGRVSQGSNSVAIGLESASNTQGANSIAIGWEAGQENQGSNSVAIGVDAAIDTQGTGCVAVGVGSGGSNQGNSSVAVGQSAGYSNLGSNSVAVGAGAAGANSGTYVTAIGYDAGRAALGSNSIAIGALSANGGMGEFSTYIGTCFTTEGAVPTKTIVLNNTGLAMNPANDNAFYVGKITSQASGVGFNMVAHNNGTGEFIQTLTSSLSLDSTISNTQRISYDTGLLTTTIDGLLKVNGNAEFTQSVTADTTLNVLGLTTLSSCVITNMSAGVTSEVVYWDASSGKLAHAPANAIGLTPANTFVVAENGSDSTGDGSFINPYKTIQFAINQCTDGAQDNGQTIWVMAGLYVEDLTIANKNINIRGSGDTGHTYNTTIRGNMTITSSNTNRSYRTVSFQDIQIQNYTATTGKAITLSTSGTGKGKLVLNGCYVIGASTGVSLLDATATNCDWQIIANSTRFYTGFAYSAPLINLGGNQGTSCSLTLNQCTVEYESPAGSTNSLVKVDNYSAFNSQYSTITQPLNASLNNSALTNGLVWVANLPNSGVVATSTNGVTIGTTLLFSGTQATLGVAGTPAMYVNRGCPSVYVLTGTISVRSSSPTSTHCIVGSTVGAVKTILYYGAGNMMVTNGCARQIDNGNITTTQLPPMLG